MPVHSHTQLLSPTRVDKRLAYSTFIAALAHVGLILGVGFIALSAPARLPPSLEVILLEQRAPERPSEADYLANVDADGGGSSDTRDRPSSPFRSTRDSPDDGIAEEASLTMAPEKDQPLSQHIIHSVYSTLTLNMAKYTQEISTPKPYVADVQSEHSVAVAKLTEEVRADLERYAKRPRKTFVTARAKASPAARYMNSWVSTVERLGNLNYPDSARRNQLSGIVVLSVGISHEGGLQEMQVKRSSGNPVLDQAAQQLVELAAPFPAFDADLAADTDLLYITRSWVFQANAALTSQ